MLGFNPKNKSNSNRQKQNEPIRNSMQNNPPNGTPPNQMNGGQVPPNQMNGGQVPPNQMNGGQVPPNQMNGGQVPPNQMNGGPLNPRNTNDRILNRSKQQPNKMKDNSKTILIVCAVLILALSGGVFMLWQKSNAEAEQNLKAQQAIKQAQEKLKNVSENDDTRKIKAGAPNLYWNTITKNDCKIENFSGALKSIKGVQVSTDYEIRKITTVTDFVNYTKHRSVTADGLEFYWLDAIYGRKPYLIQVPFAIFKELPKEGITVVDMECVTLKNGQEMIGYMKVRKDYKSLLDKHR